MARTRTKCLFIFFFSIALYIVVSFITLLFRENGVLDVPASFVESEKLELSSVNLRYLPRTNVEKHVWRGYEQERDADASEISDSNESRNQLPDIESENNGEDNVQGPKPRFLYVFRYYEQLGRATANILALASLAKFKNRAIVVPFVNNSRMSGLPGGVSHYHRKVEKVKNYAPLDTYFDVQDFNFKLESHGYSTFKRFHDLEHHCSNRFQVVVHFLFDKEDFMKNTASWYRASDAEVKAMYKQAKEHNGWIDCPWIKRSRLSKQIGFKISRYVCVDPEVIRSGQELEDKVLQGATCVGIVQWRGTGDERTHFPLHPAITNPLQPSDLEFNANLVRIATNFVKNTFKGKFIGVQVRSERHVQRKGANVTRRCFEKLAARVQESREAIHARQVYLASDLTDYGSDTLRDIAGAKDRQSLSLFLHKLLNNPDTFDPTGILYDNGAIAIVEINILSMATRLFTLGGGNYQEWAVGLFLKRHNDESRRIHRMCELV